MHIKFPSEFKELVSRHNWSSPVFLKQIESFRRDFANNYDLRECALVVVFLEIGSILVKMVIPKSVEGALRSVDLKFISRHRITYMDFGGTPVYLQVSWFSVSILYIVT